MLAQRRSPLAHHARAFSDKPALIMGDAHRTFAELNARVNRLVHALRRAGVGAGDAVGAALPNGFEWYELLLQPGGALVSQPHEPGSREHLTVLSGSIDVTSGDECQRLKHGETARYRVDRPHAIRNAGKGVATALLVVMHSA